MSRDEVLTLDRCPRHEKLTLSLPIPSTFSPSISSTVCHPLSSPTPSLLPPPFSPSTDKDKAGETEKGFYSESEEEEGDSSGTTESADSGEEESGEEESGLLPNGNCWLPIQYLCF